MRLKTKLVVSATGLTCAIVLILSALFVSELMRQRIEQTVTANDMLAHQVYLMTRQAVVSGLTAHPPVDRSDDAGEAGSAAGTMSVRPRKGSNTRSISESGMPGPSSETSTSDHSVVQRPMRRRWTNVFQTRY